MNSCCCQWDASLGRVFIEVIFNLKKSKFLNAVCGGYFSDSGLLQKGGPQRAEGKGLKAGDRPLSYTNAAATPFLNWFSVMAD